MKKLLLSIAFMFVVVHLFAQDIIYKKNKEQINCKVIEIGLVEVKYVIPEKYKDVVMVIAKDDIEKIKYANGEEVTFTNEMYDKKSYAENHLNVIKFHLFSPLNTTLSFGYEHSLGAGKSVEATLGIVGIGYDPLEIKPAGAYFQLGYKFIKSPDFYLRGMRYAHLLKGTYFKPEIAFSGFSYANTYYDMFSNPTGSRRKVYAGAILLNVGKQWVFDNRFSIDFSVGFGYGVINESSYKSFFSPYGFGVDKASGFAMTSSFSVGYLF